MAGKKKKSKSKKNATTTSAGNSSGTRQQLEPMTAAQEVDQVLAALMANAPNEESALTRKALYEGRADDARDLLERRFNASIDRYMNGEVDSSQFPQIGGSSTPPSFAINDLEEHLRRRAEQVHVIQSVEIPETATFEEESLTEITSMSEPEVENERIQSRNYDDLKAPRPNQDPHDVHSDPEYVKLARLYRTQLDVAVENEQRIDIFREECNILRAERDQAQWMVQELGERREGEAAARQQRDVEMAELRKQVVDMVERMSKTETERNGRESEERQQEFERLKKENDELRNQLKASREENVQATAERRQVESEMKELRARIRTGEEERLTVKESTPTPPSRFPTPPRSDNSSFVIDRLSKQVVDLSWDVQTKNEEIVALLVKLSEA